MTISTSPQRDKALTSKAFTNSEGTRMYPDNRPLETLAAFALSFVAGALSAAALNMYASWVHKQVVIKARMN